MNVMSKNDRVYHLKAQAREFDYNFNQSKCYFHLFVSLFQRFGIAILKYAGKITYWYFHPCN